MNTAMTRKEDILKLQKLLEGWEGPSLADISSEKFHQSDVMKISGSKNQHRYCFLFDNMFIYCQKTMKGTYQVKGQIPTDHLTVINLNDGEAKLGKTPVKNAFKINNESKSKWYVLYTKTSEEKAMWLDAFLREREKVAEDQRLCIARAGNVPAHSSDSMLLVHYCMTCWRRWLASVIYCNVDVTLMPTVLRLRLGNIFHWLIMLFLLSYYIISRLMML